MLKEQLQSSVQIQKDQEESMLQLLKVKKTAMDNAKNEEI